MTINHDHLHGTTDKAVSLEEDYRKISAMYIDAINKSDKLDMENTELKWDIISYRLENKALRLELLKWKLAYMKSIRFHSLDHNYNIRKNAQKYRIMLKLEDRIQKLEKM